MIMSGIERKYYEKGYEEGYKEEHKRSLEKIANYFINEGFSEIDAKRKTLEILS